MPQYIQDIIKNMPQDWLRLTTHRLDIYDEPQAKTQFLQELKKLVEHNDLSAEALSQLPTAFDYIRLGHPLSCVLEWFLAEKNQMKADAVISFDSKVMPTLAVLRKNKFLNKKTQLLYVDELPEAFNKNLVDEVYGYQVELLKVNDFNAIPNFEGSTILIDAKGIQFTAIPEGVDFYIQTDPQFGSVIYANGTANEAYIGEIQHVRRRETIAMTPSHCFHVLQQLVGLTPQDDYVGDLKANKKAVENEILKITHAASEPLVASSGLSMQYSIMMGLIDEAQQSYPGKAIKFIVPPNCYGGTNDQARRVAACLDHVEVMDLPVDAGHDMVDSVEKVLTEIAAMDAVPYIIAEIPTNPRVEVPHLVALSEALAKQRQTPNGAKAIPPVFILDQTFCPNVNFLGDDAVLAAVQTISYASGSKFPSGGKCTAGYAVGNQKASHLMANIEKHMTLCENEATPLQYHYLAEQLPSMLQRIADAYVNTRSFVTFIAEQLPMAKINFVSEELASQGFTPSVFSLNLPTKGATEEEREAYKRAMNLKLIDMMIQQIPNESKYCVSYGQLKGCYWTIPATSTQGTTKEGDKDYIARVALSGNMNLDQHKQVFLDFIKEL